MPEEKENEEKTQLAYYGELIGQMMKITRQHIFEIYSDEELKAGDKHRLKEFYLQHIARPDAEEIFEKHFPTKLRAAAESAPEPGDASSLLEHASPISESDFR